MDRLNELQDWYAAQCDGEWEHRYGVSIESLDNPGWLLKVELTGTALAARRFEAIRTGVGEGDHPVSRRWMVCEVKDQVWVGAGDESKLKELLRVFLDWAAPGDAT